MMRKSWRCGCCVGSRGIVCHIVRLPLHLSAMYDVYDAKGPDVARGHGHHSALHITTKSINHSAAMCYQDHLTRYTHAKASPFCATCTQTTPPVS